MVTDRESEPPPSSSPDRNGDASQPDEAVSRAFRDAARRLDELQEHFRRLLAIRWDSLQLALRNWGLWAVIGAGCLLMLAALGVTAIVFLVSGLAGALTQLLSCSDWVGELLAGVLTLAVIVLAAALTIRRVISAWRQALVEKYETRKQDRREADERNVPEAKRAPLV